MEYVAHGEMPRRRQAVRLRYHAFAIKISSEVRAREWRKAKAAGVTGRVAMPGAWPLRGIMKPR